MATRHLHVNASHLIAPFGPGAIIDLLGESFMAMTGEHWPPRERLVEVECDRLAHSLGVQRFYQPPMEDDCTDRRAIAVPVIRFPSWHFCQTCRQMVRWTPGREVGSAPLCPGNGGRLVPMRFVLVCRDRSHAADVPWSAWVHRAPGAKDCTSHETLRFCSSPEGGSGLGSLRVECDSCGRSRTLGDLRTDVLAREGFTCQGIQPWEPRDESKPCDSPLQVVQRGATSVHFGETQSAIDIPATTGRSLSREDEVRRHALYPSLRQRADRPGDASALARMIADDVGVKVDIVLAVARGAVDSHRPLVQSSQRLLLDELAAFEAATHERANEDNFKTRSYVFDTRSTDPIERTLARLVRAVVLVDRLREVRASVGFSRYRVDAERVPAVITDLSEAPWLPAIEGYGEGIFLFLDGDAVGEWSADTRVVDRSHTLERSFVNSRFTSRLHEYSAQYVALHSLAHALLRELAFSSGYSAASLRERIYCDVERSRFGVFIYTTSSDEEGTLGGLVREGEPDRLGTVLVRAIEHIAWCSNDPVCTESGPHNIDGLNLAACHACLLASETSCTGFNLLLDRIMLIGDEHVPGLLQPIFAEIAS